MTEVSIVLGMRGREAVHRRTLKSYTKLIHKDYEILFMDVVHKGGNLRHLFEEFKDQLPIRYIPLQEDMAAGNVPGSTWTPATTWNQGIKAAEGKFILTGSGDILLSYPDLIERYLAQYQSDRISVLTYFLSSQNTDDLDTIDWYGNPDSIQDMQKFWYEKINGEANQTRKLAGLTTYLTGQPKEKWEWMGLYRTELSHLVNDQDMVLRDVACGRGVGTLEGYVAYHQAHPVGDGTITKMSPGWTYQNEAQARLLEPAKRDAA